MSTLDQAMNYLADVAQGYTWSSAKSFSLTRKNCNGTINGSFSYRIRSDNKAIVISGRVYITSFSRTGANPGFTFADIGIPTTAGNHMIGYRGESPIESLNINFGARTITTNETFSNCSGSRLTFMVPETVLHL